MQNIPDVIQVKKFEVVSDDGKVVVRMESRLHQGVNYGFVTTLNSKGQPLVILSASDAGGYIGTKNGKGEITSQSP